jgi:nitrate/TMAO reductase-like tetraheme cytochrome c subunit
MEHLPRMKSPPSLRQFYAEKIRPHLAAFMAGALFAVIVAGMAYAAIHGTSKTSFCLSCHEMQQTEGELARSGHGMNRSGLRIECADCHITPGIAGMVKAKWTGLQEMKIHILENPSKDSEKWADRRQKLRRKVAREMPQQNCLHCHDLGRMKGISPATETAHRTITADMRCLDCHSVEGMNYLVHNPEKE